MANFKPSLSASEALKLIECPVCYEVTYPPIYQCHNGHIICNGCIGKVTVCPECRTPLPQVRIRSLMAEKLTEHITQIKCPNAKYGCKIKGRQENIEKHIPDCDYCPREFCNVLGLGSLFDCTKAITKHEISAHMKNEHMINVVESSQAKIVQVMGRGQNITGLQKWLPITFSVYNEHFFIISEMVKKPNETTVHVSWKCIIAAPATISSKYSVQLKLLNPEKNLELIWNGPVISIDEMDKDVNYLVAPLDRVHLFNKSTTGTIEWGIIVFIRQIGKVAAEIPTEEIKLVRSFLLLPVESPERKNTKAETKKNKPERELHEDLSKAKEDLKKLVEEKNISEIVRILSVTFITKYQLEVSGDEIELIFEREPKKMDLVNCSLNLDSLNRISAEELTLANISFHWNGKELDEVNANEFLDMHKINKLTLICVNKNMSLDLSDESVSLEYLYLCDIKVLDWKEAKWTVKELELFELPFTENTKMKVKEMKIEDSPLVDISCLPQTLEKLTLSSKKVRCAGRIELPNLKYLQLWGTSNNLLSHFRSVNLTHLHLDGTTGELNVDFIPKIVTHIKIQESRPPIVGGVLKLEKLILESYSANKVKEYLTHFQPKRLVVEYSRKCPSKDLLELLKVIHRIAVHRVDYDSILSKHVDRESDCYLFQWGRGKAITKEEFNKLLDF